MSVATVMGLALVCFSGIPVLKAETKEKRVALAATAIAGIVGGMLLGVQLFVVG